MPHSHRPTADSHHLAHICHLLLDIDEEAALDILRHYIEQAEDVDDRAIDEDAIGPHDANFLIGAVKAAYANGDTAYKEIFALEEVMCHYRSATAASDYARRLRDEARLTLEEVTRRYHSATATAGYTRRLRDEAQLALDEAERHYHNTAATADYVRQLRDEAIDGALTAGATYSDVADASGIDRQNIKDGDY